MPSRAGRVGLGCLLGEQEMDMKELELNFINSGLSKNCRQMLEYQILELGRKARLYGLRNSRRIEVNDTPTKFNSVNNFLNDYIHDYAG